MQRGQRHQLIAVDNLPAPVDGEHAIAVAVEGEAQGVAAGDHLLGERVHVRGAAPCVDVAPVGGCGDHTHARAEASEDLGRDLVGGAVGAVEQHIEAIEIERGEAGVQFTQVVLGGPAQIAYRPDRG